MDTEEKKFLSADLVILSSSFLLIFMGAGAFQQFMIPMLSERLGKTALESSWILAALYLSFLWWRVACSYTLKWLGDYWSLILGSLIYTIFPLAVLFTRSYALLLVLAIAWGWGAASIWISASTRVLDSSSSKKYGISSGTFYTAAQLGQAIGVILLERIIRTGGENGMLFWVFLITAAGNAMLFMLPAKTVVREQPKLAKVFGVLKSGRNKAVAFMQFASSFGFGVMMSSFADMVRSYYGILLVGTATIWFYVVRLFSSSFLGWLSDRWGRERILFLGFLLSAVGFTVVVFNHSLPAMYLEAGLLGFQFGTVPVAVMAMIGDETKPEERHLVFGGMFLWRDLGVAVAIISGMYINAFTRNYSVSFAIFAALFFVCAFLALRMKALPRKDSATVTTSATRR